MVVINYRTVLKMVFKLSKFPRRGDKAAVVDLLVSFWEKTLENTCHLVQSDALKRHKNCTLRVFEPEINPLRYNMPLERKMKSIQTRATVFYRFKDICN